MVGELHIHFPHSQCDLGSVLASFRTAHVSTGAMSMKKQEFHNLRQGNRTVAQYVDEFSTLSRYAPDDVATDAKKQERFMEGLNDEMSVQLMVATLK